MKCKQIQWQYCAAQFTYRSMMMLDNLFGELNKMVQEVNDLKEKVNAMYESDSGVFDPTSEQEVEIPTGQDKAQQGSGADIIGSQESLTN